MSASAIIGSIRTHFPHFSLVGTDIYDAAILDSRKLVDRFYTIPNCSDPGYIDTLVGLVHSEGVTLILPLTDPEVDVLSENLELFTSIGVTVGVSPADAITLSRDKRAVGNFFASHRSVKTPRMYSIDEIESQQAPFPLVSKPARGRSSQGLRVYRSYDELPRKLDSRVVYQAYIEGRVFTVDLVRDLGGQIVALPRMELLRTAGGAGLTVSVDPDRTDLIQLAQTVVEALGLIGAVNLEFIYDGTSFYLIDVNPRFSAGVGFSIASGFEIVKHHIDVFSGHAMRVDSPPFKRQILTKVYKDYVL